MTKIILVFFFLLICDTSFSQWNISGNNIGNSNTGDVLINGPSNLKVYGKIVALYPKSNTPLSGEFLGTSGWWGFRTDTNNKFNIDIYNANNPKSALSIDQVGNIGIGTTSPDSKLTVSGSGIGSLFSISTVGSNAYFKIGLNTDYAWLQSYGPRPMRINELGNDVIFNIGGGNVGIGTIAPDAKLAVKGTIHAQEVKVDLNVPGPDYVFEPTYDLKPLAEIETYIKENKHLPEVPSAKEMEKNGVQLGEMNMLLLKKVEELTLYLIKQQSMIEAQNKEIEKLKTQIK
jgi:hypothetical protein